MSVDADQQLRLFVAFSRQLADRWCLEVGASGKLNRSIKNIVSWELKQFISNHLSEVLDGLFTDYECPTCASMTRGDEIDPGSDMICKYCDTSLVVSE